MKALYGFEGAEKHFQRGACKGRRELRGGVAQLGERLPCKQEAKGSKPFSSTIWGSGEGRESH